jgi:hypothetical protein
MLDRFLVAPEHLYGTVSTRGELGAALRVPAAGRDCGRTVVVVPTTD